MRSSMLSLPLHPLFALLLALVTTIGCGDDDPPTTDAGEPDSGVMDPDTGPGPIDAGWECGNSRREGPETCDDGNRVTELCTYGQEACMVCDGDCQQVAGEVFFCGDGALQSDEGETCDDAERNTDGWLLASH